MVLDNLWLTSELVLEVHVLLNFERFFHKIVLLVFLFFLSCTFKRANNLLWHVHGKNHMADSILNGNLTSEYLKFLICLLSRYFGTSRDCY